MECEMVRDRIAAYLRESVQRWTVGQYLSRPMGRATIGGIDLVGAVSPLAR